MNKEIRWKQRFQNLEKAMTQLEKGVKLAQPNDLEKTGGAGLSIDQRPLLSRVGTLITSLEDPMTLNRFGLTDKSYQIILKSLKEIPEIEKVLIFGSRAMGNFKPGSDVDLALKGAKLTDRILSQVSQKLSEELPVPYLFDIVIYETIENLDLKKHIDEQGKLFYSKANGRSAVS